MITSAIRAYLIADAGVSALTTAFIPSTFVKGTTFPHVIYHRYSSEDNYDTDGNTSYRVARFQFDAYSLYDAQAEQVSTAIRKALQSFRGSLNDPDGDPIKVLGCFVTQDMMMPQEPGPTNIEFRWMLQIEIHYQEN